jgi:hypothetical protein
MRLKHRNNYEVRSQVWKYIIFVLLGVAAIGVGVVALTR